jgi:fibronectin type 3 domain-containing protein
VKRSTTSGSGFTAVASGLTAASYTDTNVSNGTTYYYVLTASNSAGESAVSAQVSASPSVAAGITPLRIDCGGSGYTSASGQVWTADKHFSSGSTYKYPSRDILGGTDDPLHLSIRLGTSFSYTLPATAGSYTLKLHFAECWFTAAGGRKFNVTVNGSQALSSFDIVAAAGGGNRLTVREIPVTVTGSSVTVTFQKVLNDALVNAIELIPSGGGGGDESPTPPAVPTGLQAAAGNGQVSLTWNAVAGATSYTVKRSTISGTSYQSVAGEVTSTSYADTNVSNGTTYYYVVAAVNAVGESADSSQVSATPTAPASGGVALRIDSGGKGYTSAAGVAWTADQRFSGGSTYTYPARDILGGTDDPLHLSIRLGRSFSYTLPAAPGAYTLRLHFAECWFTAAGGRKFNVTVNGSPALTNFDVAAAAGGGNRLVVRELPVTVTGASVTVAFQTVLNDALVNAIELIPSDGGGEETPTPPAAPTGLQATAGNGQVSLSWAPSTGAASYTVKRSVAGGASYQTVAGEVASASYTDTAVNNGTTYQYVVSASNADGESADSTQVSATPTSPGAGTTTLRINCGGAGFTGAGGVVWSADQYSSGGAKYLYPARDIAGTAEDYRYYSVRYSEGAAFSYSLPATAGAYTLKLHFAECWFTTAGGRKFNVNVNGSTVLNSFDVVAAAGSGNTAVVREFPVTAGANGVVVQFQSVLNGPIISGIELIPAP